MLDLMQQQRDLAGEAAAQKRRQIMNQRRGNVWRYTKDTIFKRLPIGEATELVWRFEVFECDTSGRNQLMQTYYGIYKNGNVQRVKTVDGKIVVLGN